MEIKLYTTSGCHLCEDALALLHQAQLSMPGISVCEVEISESELLINAYGTRIPVVATPDGELGWPFTYEALIHFLDSAT